MVIPRDTHPVQLWLNLMIVAGSYLLPRHSLSLLTAAFGAVFSLAFAPSFAVGQMVTANDDVVEDSNVPKWLRDRPLGLTFGYVTAFEGSGELTPSISLASDYSSAKAARSPLEPSARRLFCPPRPSA